ncbi:SAM-dependent DNA methyltransferase [Leptolyngbya sp. FACHB-541]|uniref:SAM-dependent DNA methyltransferase n=1 Tax=Leptolyngbya sp. FACHB-541 TaxID=2692810 RepID=UPI0016839C86|nr:SAM-dependent DNA methyltransferase [Leptolyngbya sp. FACHB-541]MBD1995249.1 SAM-dependent DNA methyltransferase [Leptolyngbya sp. FACHB-541]
MCDPCLGTGRLLLTASNYSLRLYGQDINDTVIKAALVNGYLYAPWLVKPLPFLDSELLYGDLAEIPARGRSASISDSMTATADQNPAAAQYLAETEHDAENQWKFEPIKKRKRKGKNDSEEVWQGSIF